MGACVGTLSGSASAIFLLSLDWVSGIRDAYLWLLAGLPLAGFAIGYCYHRYGSGVEKGNNLSLIGLLRLSGPFCLSLTVRIEVEMWMWMMIETMRLSDYHLLDIVTYLI